MAQSDGPYGPDRFKEPDPAEIAQANRERAGIHRRRDAEIREARASGRPPDVVQKLIDGTKEKFEQEMIEWARKWGIDTTAAVEALNSDVRESRRRKRQTEPDEPGLEG